MIGIARLKDSDRMDLFRNTASKMGLNDAIVEKDFWVCYTLDFLFHRTPWFDHFSFKGGTSLSKAYHLISRFSEDIDLIMDWRLIGYGKDEPWEVRSKSKQEAYNLEMNARTEAFLADVFCNEAAKAMSTELGREVDLRIDPLDPMTVLFAYPTLFSGTVTMPMIRLEIGALAAWTPASPANVSPFAAEHYPRLFDTVETSIRTVAPERTFWEKATILHHEANRPESSPMPTRYARHYYDLFRMIESPVKATAMKSIDLLAQVVAFKMKFYPRGWARYEDAKPGTMRLVPPDSRITALKADYSSMKEMIFGDIPPFSQILSAVRTLEDEINSAG